MVIVKWTLVRGSRHRYQRRGSSTGRGGRKHRRSTQQVVGTRSAVRRFGRLLEAIGAPLVDCTRFKKTRRSPRWFTTANCTGNVTSRQA